MKQTMKALKDHVYVFLGLILNSKSSQFVLEFSHHTVLLVFLVKQYRKETKKQVL